VLGVVSGLVLGMRLVEGLKALEWMWVVVGKVRG
jgi:hypothetical protein